MFAREGVLGGSDRQVRQLGRSKTMRAVPLDLTADLQTVEAREHQIENHSVWS